MSKYIDADRLREEIERRIEAHHMHDHFCAEHEFRELLSFLSDIEKSLPAKVADDGLNGEIERYFEGWSDDSEYGQALMRNGACTGVDECKDIARHFYELGCHRTAEKYDEIEYNRQRGEEPPVALVAIKPILPAALKPCIATFKEQGGSSEIPKDLEEAADKYEKERPYNDFVSESIKLAFIAGYKYHADHAPLPEDTVLFNNGVEEGKRLMMEEAVEGEVMLNPYPTICLDDCKDYDFKDGDKVRVIIIKKED